MSRYTATQYEDDTLYRYLDGVMDDEESDGADNSEEDAIRDIGEEDQ